MNSSFCVTISVHRSHMPALGSYNDKDFTGVPVSGISQETLYTVC